MISSCNVEPIIFMEILFSHPKNDLKEEEKVLMDVYMTGGTYSMSVMCYCFMILVEGCLVWM